MGEAELRERPASEAEPIFFKEISAPDRRPAEAGILTFSNGSSDDPAVLRNAVAVGRGLRLPVTIAGVVEAPQQPGSPADPVQWQLLRHEHQDQVERLVALESADTALATILLSGSASDQLVKWGAGHGAVVLALATRDGGESRPGALGTIAERVAERSSASLLLVPPSATAAAQPHYHKLLVPLDGSSRAESVLPVASRIARAHGAEIVLVHVVPRATLVHNHLGQQASKLSAQLCEENERIAREYLDDVRRKLCNSGLRVRAIITTDGDPRGVLRQVAAQQRIDLVVVSSHGQTGLADVPLGSVAEYLAAHSPAPLLIVRPTFNHGFGTAPAAPANVRLVQR